MQQYKKVVLLHYSNSLHYSAITYRDFELDVQSTLLSYLRILLTEWDNGYQDRSSLVLQHIRNKTVCHEMLVSVLTTKVS